MRQPEWAPAPQDTLRPAFRTKREGALFVLLVVVLLAMPFVPKRCFISQRDIYRTLPPLNGSWDYFWSEVIPDPDYLPPSHRIKQQKDQRVNPN